MRRGAMCGKIRNLSPTFAHHTLVAVLLWTTNVIAVRSIRECIVNENVATSSHRYCGYSSTYSV